MTSWQYTVGLKSQPAWMSYLIATVALLWNTGGLVLPLGTILVKPIAVTALGEGVGLVAAAPNLQGVLSSIMIGTPPKHAILKELLNTLARYLSFI